MPPDVILSVRDLRVDYYAARGRVQAVRGAGFDLRSGETLALIGESGSGKTTMALALIRMLARGAHVRAGTVLYRGPNGTQDVLRLRPNALRRFRWRECAFVFQSAQNALNPVLRVSQQFQDVAQAHGQRDRRAVRARSLELLRMVQLDAERVYSAYPHELSGGMRQRVLIALGLLLKPSLVILDEPTTALDILTQRTIIDLLRRLKSELGFAMILVSHDLSLAAELADRVATVYAGRVVELADVRQLFYQPHHPYSVGLLRAVPTLSGSFRALESVRGSPPDLIDLPPGCAFQPRCPYATEECLRIDPALEPVGDTSGHSAACLRSSAVAADWRAVQVASQGEANGANPDAGLLPPTAAIRAHTASRGPLEAQL